MDLPVYDNCVECMAPLADKTDPFCTDRCEALARLDAEYGVRS